MDSGTHETTSYVRSLNPNEATVSDESVFVAVLDGAAGIDLGVRKQVPSLFDHPP